MPGIKDVFKLAGQSLGRSPVGLGTTIGAVSGGVYGAFSNDTSVLRGMAGGAALGAMGGVGVRYGRIGAKEFQRVVPDWMDRSFKGSYKNFMQQYKHFRGMGNANSRLGAINNAATRWSHTDPIGFGIRRGMGAIEHSLMQDARQVRLEANQGINFFHTMTGNRFHGRI